MNIAKILGLGLIFVFICSFAAFAAKNAETTTDTTTNEKTGNFGQCVSDGATVKNTCYKTVKETLASCNVAAKNMTDSAASKTAKKECKATYKKDMKQCKMDFKTVKKECGKIKHSAFEGFKASFK